MTSADMDVALEAAQAGAAVVRARYGSRLERYDKSPTDFATDADIEAEGAILAVIRAARPGDAVHGEESGVSSPEGSHRTWLVDPLCGTLNFAAQTPLVAVNVALTMPEGTAAAVSADPLADEVFWADGAAAYVRRSGVDVPLTPSPVSRLVDVNVDPPFPNARVFSAARMLSASAFTSAFRTRVLSTTLALAWVAGGRRAGYVTDGRLEGSVHFASGIAICQAAGCVVTGLRGQPVHTGVGGLVVAADADTHALLLDVIAEQWGQHPR